MALCCSEVQFFAIFICPPRPYLSRSSVSSLTSTFPSSALVTLALPQTLWAPGLRGWVFCIVWSLCLQCWPLRHLLTLTFFRALPTLTISSVLAVCQWPSPGSASDGSLFSSFIRICHLPINRKISLCLLSGFTQDVISMRVGIFVGLLICPKHLEQHLEQRASRAQ